MNKDINSLNKSLSIQAEYEENYSEMSTRLKLLLENVIISGNIDTYRQVKADAAHMKDLVEILDEKLEVQKLYVASTIYSFVETAIKHGLPKDVAEISKKKFFAKIADCSNSRELEEYHFQIVEDLLMAMNQYSMKKYTPLIRMAIEYIHNNKLKPIFSKDVATAIKINRSYLSTKFKEETGETITDYIHKVKIDFAIQLMQSNFYKFNEIAELLGYTNYSYFSKVFKKIYNETPYDYMKRHSND
ncbi:helix-turn-helix domain-containing protein [Litchfieldia salsa]|uniref:Helix-turn-helix domain-containing protein n=1 Tax=Litchfieldia salsa TaxID=930152 RepID=A0A1H0VM34_9BACI|nr:AraC family transcriptional regulator [Litchfieldia salsa]SDP79577.1 Helix-turn-helix domain-containing protein [Litchfieldia salsa]